MEIKWAMIAMIVLFGGMFIGLGYSEHTKSQCRIASVQAGRSAEDIIKICK